MRELAPFHRALLGALVLSLAACGGEAPEAGAEQEAAPAAEATEAGEEAMAEEPASATFLDPNDASADDLADVPGMTLEAAEALVAGRPYDDMLQVDAVLAGHLDEAQRETVYASVWRPLDLNEASGQEILLIPGVGERMEHEFEEYRPYRAIAEFRREIGKYVDEEEVARLERYVELR